MEFLPAMDLEQAIFHTEESSVSSEVESSEDPTTTRGEGEEDSASQEEVIAREETKAVNRSKALVYFMILIAAGAIGAATYIFTSNELEDDFENEFEQFASEIIEVANNNAVTMFGQLRSLGTAVTSHAMALNSSWPNVTLPDFDMRTKEIEALAGAEMILFVPVVKAEDKEAWERYAIEHQRWIDKDLKARGWADANLGSIQHEIYPYPDSGVHRKLADRQGIYLPVWQYGPAPTDSSLIMADLFSHPVFERMVIDLLQDNHALLSEVADVAFLMHHINHADKEQSNPRSVLFQPIWDSFNQGSSKIVGFVVAVLGWDAYFNNVLPVGVNGFVVNVHDTCGSEFTYTINGPKDYYKGNGDLHDPKYDRLAQRAGFAEFGEYNGNMDDEAHCHYSITVYPSDDFHQTFESNEPILYTFVVLLVFFFTGMVFVLYDFLVQRRQHKVMSTATRTTAIVTSMFPKEVGKRLIEEAHEQAEEEEKAKRKGLGFRAKSNLKDLLNDDGEMELEVATNSQSKPIADLFPEVTIMFADIVGFTAWSSVREPTQVFTLLETIYKEFDEIAKRRRVFKVETVGDCYVAVAGLPQPRKDHQTVMARFARDCIYRLNVLMRHLEEELGPDTADLGMRFGLHSGPVTAGVLRGERSRFQLFGDTVNTTARMESTGEKNKIHISQETADLLTAAGKSHWVTMRQDKVVAKGKGELQTYWLDLKGTSTASAHSRSTNTSDSGSNVDDIHTLFETQTKISEQIRLQAVASEEHIHTISEKQMRLVNWNCDILRKLLQDISVRRKATGTQPDPIDELRTAEQNKVRPDCIVLEEVKEIIHLPEFDPQAAEKQEDPDSVQLPNEVLSQLHSYLLTIAALYRDNPFHNFDHASHVTMSVVKLLGRIVAPDLTVTDENNVARRLHDHTYGITSDPLTQFAVILAAVIHDVDHSGVPNSQLIKERDSIAAAYKNKSVAEQNSVDIAWNLLMEDCYEDLRRAIYSTDREFKHFRQVLVNTVMATDIMDKELKALRNARWDKAFKEAPAEESIRDSIDRKATIVIEHIIQASDVSHTMQHWHIYRKWNERLFMELYRAYKDGRSEKSPVEFWYQGEIGFFDFYIIPLARKLKDCGVFGVSSDEYLTYARQNRQEWERKGREIVAELQELADCRFGDKRGGSTSLMSLEPINPVQQTASATQA